jgi:hypothetical protein
MQTRKSFARIERETKIAEARRAEIEKRARDRESLRQRALVSAREYGADDYWRTYWTVIGLDDDELFAILAQITLEASGGH